MLLNSKSHIDRLSRFSTTAHIEKIAVTIKSINKHLLIGPDAYPLDYILHGLWEVTSDRQVISHDPSVTSMVIQEMHNVHLFHN